MFNFLALMQKPLRGWGWYLIDLRPLSKTCKRIKLSISKIVAGTEAPMSMLVLPEFSFRWVNI